MENKYIMTSDGFVENHYKSHHSWTGDDGEEKHGTSYDVEFTNKLIEAEVFTNTKTAKLVIERFLNGEGIVYKPFEQLNLDRCYQVKLTKVSQFMGNFDGSIYAPIKVQHMNDINSMYRYNEYKDLMTYEEAVEEAQKKNHELINDIKNFEFK